MIYDSSQLTLVKFISNLSVALGLFLLIAPAAFSATPVITLTTKSLAIKLRVGDDGRLYQQPLGISAETKHSRDDEFYPQAGDGYIWEPALQVVHADGNTSSVLVFEGWTQTNISAG